MESLADRDNCYPLPILVSSQHILKIISLLAHPLHCFYIAYDPAVSIIIILVSSSIDKPHLIKEGMDFGSQPKAKSHKRRWFNPRPSSTQFKLIRYKGRAAQAAAFTHHPAEKMMLAVPHMSSPCPQLPQNEGITSTSFPSCSI